MKFSKKIRSQYHEKFPFVLWDHINGSISDECTLFDRHILQCLRMLHEIDQSVIIHSCILHHQLHFQQLGAVVCDISHSFRCHLHIELNVLQRRMICDNVEDALISDAFIEL